MTKRKKWQRIGKLLEFLDVKKTPKEEERERECVFVRVREIEIDREIERERERGRQTGCR